MSVPHDLKPHVLLYWESQFRFPTREEPLQATVQEQGSRAIMLVKHLLYTEKYTIEAPASHRALPPHRGLRSVAAARSSESRPGAALALGEIAPARGKPAAPRPEQDPNPR